jgi:hypothetical protein
VVIAAGCFLFAGGAVERALGLGQGFPFHRIVLGQLALTAWFYLRSLPAHAGFFGVHRIELFALVAAAAVWQARQQPPAEQPVARFFVWLALWTTLFLALAPRSGLLYTPSSDPDHHAFYARLTAQAGQVLYSLAPLVETAMRYPSGFSVLNALWMDFGFLSPVQAVNLQPALQTFLMLGLIVEAAVAARGRVDAAPLVLLIALAHFGFFLFVNADQPRLEGTPRLSDGAMLVLPLTLALRSASGWAAASLACAAWVFTQNPAHAPVALPAILGGGIALAISPPERLRWRPVAAGVAIALLLVGSDAWIRNEMSLRLALASAAPAQTPAPAGAAAHSASNPYLAALYGAAANSALAVLPKGCVPSAQCRPHLDFLREWLGPLLAVLGLLALWRGPRRSAALVIAAAAALWLASFFAGGVAAALPARADLGLRALRQYMERGFVFSTAPLFLLELMAGAALISAWLAERRLRASPALAAAGLFAASLFFTSVADPEAPFEAAQGYTELAATEPPSTLGTIQPEDLSFVRRIPGGGGKLLLPGYASLPNPWEPWFFALGGGRAIPLYSDLPFAWFEYTPVFSAAAYLRRVCRTLDLRWLWDHGVRFILEAPDEMGLMCVRALPVARERYLSPVLREGARGLHALRQDRLDEAERDPLLGVPWRAPPRGRPGTGILASIAIQGPYGVSGWACDRGSNSPVGVQLDLLQGGGAFTELHPAALPAGEDARAACASGSDAHGFKFAPVAAPAGTYRARLSVWNAAGERAQVIADGFTLTLLL